MRSCISLPQKGMQLFLLSHFQNPQAHTIMYLPKIKFSVVALLLSSCVWAQKKNDNVAYKDGNVRFTVISEGAIRMEYQPDGHFVDNASFLATQRQYPKADYQVKEGNWVEISTAKMKLKYKKNSGKFSTENLQIEAGKDVPFFSWKPGQKQIENLGGTLRTLDGMDGDKQMSDVAEAKGGEVRHLEPGLLSKDGWTFLDDSKNFLFDNSAWSWVEQRKNQDGQDWYFMSYGKNYKAALKDFTVFAGKIPLPPRYTFGYWWSRYWSYSDGEFRNLIQNFKSYDIPLDVLVVDMDWHYTDDKRGAWTGWTWNKNLFPDPPKFLQYLKSNDLKVTLNLHPADGVAPYEETYPAMKKDLGLPASYDKSIPWVGSDKQFMTAFFKNVLRPMEKNGVDFWWLDWQQDPFDKKIPTLSNTWWINYLFFSDKALHGTNRPLLYHRWGGLGNHRYQIGFSGDTHMTWNSLDYQPYFNATASNVLYGYWSHDIGGHTGGKFSDEMYLRWLQFGGLSPVMRTHSTKSADMNKEPWAFNREIFSIIKSTIKQRYEMAPYLYTMARKAYDDGVSLCYPLYYDYPNDTESYSCKKEYMLGNDMLIAPVTEASKDGFVTMDVWLPKGDWYELHTGTVLKGGQTLQRTFALDEYGIYVKAGAVLPFYADTVKNLASNNAAITLNIFPGEKGNFSLYEDAGNDKNYDKNFAWTSLASVKKGNTLEVTIGNRKGTYENMNAFRNFQIKLNATIAPTSVVMDGKSLPFQYSGEDFSVLIPLGALPCNREKKIILQFASENISLPQGIIGKSRRISKAIEALKYKDAGIILTDDFGKMGSICQAVQYHPENIQSLTNAFEANYKKLPEILKAQKLDDEKIQWFLQAIGWGKY